MLFQSTPPRRGRLIDWEEIPEEMGKFQSTPPRRGRRQNRAYLLRLRLDFNPRPREGGDYVLPSYNSFGLIFQSTPPRRGRRNVIVGTDRRIDFNPRPREGGDLTAAKNHQARWIISIHAPAKGATTDDTPYEVESMISIHAPAKGAT